MLLHDIGAESLACWESAITAVDRVYVDIQTLWSLFPFSIWA